MYPGMSARSTQLPAVAATNHATTAKIPAQIDLIIEASRDKAAARARRSFTLPAGQVVLYA
jgi:hypothetical protein